MICSRTGKAQAINDALAFISSDAVFCVDADTYPAPDCLENLAKHLVGDVVIVGPSVAPAGSSTFVDKVRKQAYYPRQSPFISGCAFLARTDYLRENPLGEQTMVEDEEMTRVLNDDPVRLWLLCKSAKAYTEEPRTMKTLFSQLIRWRYGRYELDRKKSRLPLAEAIIILSVLFTLQFIVALNPGLAFLDILDILFFLALILGESRSLKPAFLKYAFVSASSMLWVFILICVRRKPNWGIV